VLARLPASLPWFDKLTIGAIEQGVPSEVEGASPPVFEKFYTREIEECQ